jgi:hypothetical protein
MLNTRIQENTQTLMEQMEESLAHLALHWRGHTTPEDSEELVRRYNAILTCMLKLGLDHPLDIDSELPDELMPQAYFERFK